MTLRGLFELRPRREPIAIEEVEPISEIVKRFNTGAMSYGSISMEAHETLAIAMNRLGGRSNTGEGARTVERLLDPTAALGDQAGGVRPLRVTVDVPHPRRRHPDQDGAGRQAGRRGPAAGAEGLPWVARTRHSTPGVGLISPPPHHDIYPIEDLAQLIHDL